MSRRNASAEGTDLRDHKAKSCHDVNKCVRTEEDRIGMFLSLFECIMITTVLRTATTLAAAEKYFLDFVCSVQFVSIKAHAYICTQFVAS